MRFLIIIYKPKDLLIINERKIESKQLNWIDSKCSKFRNVHPENKKINSGGMAILTQKQTGHI